MTSIVGRIYQDKNGNNVWDGDPPDFGLVGATVNARAVASSTIIGSAVTGAEGIYNLTFPTQTVEVMLSVVPPTGWCVTCDPLSPVPLTVVAPGTDFGSADWTASPGVYSCRGACNAPPTFTSAMTRLYLLGGGGSPLAPVTAADPNTPITFTVTAGTLPTGVTMSTSGVFTGNAANSTSFTVTATDSLGASSTQVITVTGIP
jgi:large repetitive protein